MSWSRLLLDSAAPGADEDTGETGQEDGAEIVLDGDSTKWLRVASVFIILAAGLIGGLPPLFSKVFRNSGHPVARIVRALSAGIILALALIHILPEAVLEMAELEQYMDQDHPYNPAGACAVFGAILMVILESWMHAFMEARARRQSRDAAVASKLDGIYNDTAQPVLNLKKHLQDNPSATPSPRESHVNIELLSEAYMGIKHTVVASMFELGCIFHSFIIGISLGVNITDIKSVRSLLIALTFHQWLEGLALGAFIVRASINTSKGIGMIITYSLTCPLGVAIGIAISNTYDPESIKAIAVQGAFNGVSAGMLLYVALVQLIAEDSAARDGQHGGSSHCHSGQGSESTSVTRPRRITSLHHTDCHAATEHFVRDDDCQYNTLDTLQCRREPGLASQSQATEACRTQDKGAKAHTDSAHVGQIGVTVTPASEHGQHHAHREPVWVQPVVHISLFLGAAFMALLGIWA